VTEAELQACVIDLAHVYGWKVAHFRPAMTAKGWRTPVGADGKGFPDLVLCKPGKDERSEFHRFSEPSELMFVELKAKKGRLTLEQIDWLDWLGFHADAMVWTPAEWEDGTILKALSGVAA
jgi:hypothetical protein